MALEIITTEVKMPLPSQRRYQYKCNSGNLNGLRSTYDTHSDNQTIKKGKFDDVTFFTYFANKKYYSENPI